MTRLNLVLLAAVVASALYLVHIQFESRQLFVQIDRAEAEARKLAIENDRLQVEKRAQATPLRVEKLARDQLRMRTTSPAITQPVWRSKFIVAAIALGFVGLAGRAAYIQVFGNAFFQRQGEVRFARTLELPANRGRILDRNGLILASSVVAQSIWAIPEDIDRDKDKIQQLARLLSIPLAELNKKIEDEDKTFVWLKRQVDESVAQQIADVYIASRTVTLAANEVVRRIDAGDPVEDDLAVAAY